MSQSEDFHHYHRRINRHPPPSFQTFAGGITLLLTLLHDETEQPMGAKIFDVSLKNVLALRIKISCLDTVGIVAGLFSNVRNHAFTIFCPQWSGVYPSTHHLPEERIATLRKFKKLSYVLLVFPTDLRVSGVIKVRTTDTTDDSTKSSST